MSRRFRTLTTIAVLHTSLVLTPNLHAQPFSEIVAFGASLTDSGNIAIASPAVFGHSIPVSPPYFMGRFTNGPSWLDVLADSLDVDRPLPSRSGGTNYAWGGATIGTVPNEFEDLGLLNLDEQVSSFLSENTPSGDELFVLAAVAAAGDFANGQEDPAAPAQLVGQLISDLSAAGASNVLVMSHLNSPRLTRPDLVDPYNVELSSVVSERRAALEGLTIYEFDADSVLQEIVASPGDYGILFLEDQACLDCGPFNESPTTVENPNEYLYFDGVVHFTEPVHREFGIRASQAVPEPSSASLLFFGLASAIFRRKSH